MMRLRKAEYVCGGRRTAPFKNLTRGPSQRNQVGGSAAGQMTRRSLATPRPVDRAERKVAGRGRVRRFQLSTQFCSADDLAILESPYPAEDHFGSANAVDDCIPAHAAEIHAESSEPDNPGSAATDDCIPARAANSPSSSTG